jgi:ubiquitin carboxyl-terminal hydrolase 14
MLKCNIDGNTNHLHEGLQLGMVDDRERHSEALGRTALFKGSSTITSLPVSPGWVKGLGFRVYLIILS